MNTLLAEHAGFCFGVNRAVDGVYDLIEKEENIYTYGPVIHNEKVIEDLKSKGVEILNGIEDLKNIKNATVAIRAHGVPKSVYDYLENAKIRYVDFTCPFVKRIHNTVKEMSQKGYQIVIIGSSGHPEVLGIKGWADETAVVIDNKQDALNFEPGQSCCSSSTFARFMSNAGKVSCPVS